MLVTVEGIVLGIRTVGENNCFIDVLTDEFGIVEATAHGIKKITSKNAGACSLFAYSKFCFNKNGLKYTLNSAEPKISFHNISSDLEALSLAAYFAEVVKYTVASEQDSSGFLRFMAITLYELEKKRVTYEFVKAAFELHISVMLGFSPDLRACRECLCYESDRMYFDYNESDIVCGDCLSETAISDCIELTPSLLFAMRHIVYSEVDKIYKLNIQKEDLVRLSELSEKYLLSQLDKSFRSLTYYKNIRL